MPGQGGVARVVPLERGLEEGERAGRWWLRNLDMA